MWLFTKAGFFSAVRRGDRILVRSRVGSDLDRLRQLYLPELGTSQATPELDYPFRATVDPAAFAAAMPRMARDLDYPNFKAKVREIDGEDRAHVYADVWEAAHGLQELNCDMRPTKVV